MIHWGRLGIIKAARKKASLHVPMLAPETSLQPLNINSQIFPTVTHKLSVLPTARFEQFKR